MSEVLLVALEEGPKTPRQLVIETRMSRDAVYAALRRLRAAGRVVEVPPPSRTQKGVRGLLPAHFKLPDA